MDVKLSLLLELDISVVSATISIIVRNAKLRKLTHILCLRLEDMTKLQLLSSVHSNIRT